MPNHDEPIPAGALRTDTLADSVLILVGLTAVQRLVGFVRAVLFCRWLDVEQLGQWDMAFGFLVLAAPLAVLAVPGAFGRYVEHYRQIGQLRTFLRRTLVLCASLSLAAAAAIYLGRSGVSSLVFGTPDHAGLVAMLALSLVAVIALNFCTELFNALRSVRMVAGLQLFNSLVFAALAIALVLGWRKGAESVVLAYGGACLASAMLAACYLATAWSSLPGASAPLPHRVLWSKIAPFAGWMLATNLLANLFDVADRAMIVHWSVPAGVDPLAIVGQYHSSRVVPLLLASVAMILGSMITPHMSCDWEAGRRDRVVLRLNLFMKLLALALTFGAVVVLAASPLLFHVAFQGKFGGGEAVLPWTLVYCIWFGMAMVAQNYLWCAEKARLACVGLLAGLCVNVSLNALLLPRLGLLGAVLATSGANLVVLLSVLGFAHRLGFRADRGTWLTLAAPAALVLGPWIALAVLAAMTIEAIASDRLFSREEKTLLLGKAADYAGRIRDVGFKWRPAAGRVE